MFFTIKVIPNSNKPRVCFESFSSLAGEKKSEGIFKVYVKSPPVEGKANSELIEILSEYFNVRKNQIEIVHGKKSRRKVIKIL